MGGAAAVKEKAEGEFLIKQSLVLYLTTHYYKKVRLSLVALLSVCSSLSVYGCAFKVLRAEYAGSLSYCW